MNGAEQLKTLTAAGYTQDELSAWKADTTKKLSDGGFSTQDIGKYFGEPEPNMAPTKEFFAKNLAAGKPAAEGEKPTAPAGPISISDALDAGYQSSVSGLIKRGKLPDQMLPEDAPMWAKILSNLGQVGGDLPAMLAGAWAGGEAGAAAGAPTGAAIGSVIPGPGTVAGAAVGAAGGGVMGAGAGAFALPSYLRKLLVTQYQQGSVKDSKDFWGRQAAAFLDAYKDAQVGAATAGVGGIAEKAVVQPLVGSATKLASEAATMVTLGKAAQGQLPEPQDFVTAGALVAGLHVATAGAGQVARLTGKAGDVYAKTGTSPTELAQETQANPVVRQEMASDNIDVPQAFADRVDPAMAEPPAKPLPVPEPMKEAADVGGEPTGVSLKPAEEEKPAATEEEPPPKSTAEPTANEQVQARIASPDNTRKGASLDQIYTAMMDDLHPIKQLSDMLAGDKPLTAKEDPYMLARLTRGSYGRADQFLEYSPFKFDSLQNTGKPLSKVLEPVRDNIDEFRAYAVARRAVELEGRGVETGVPMDAARATVDGGKKFEKTFQDLKDYQRNTLTYLRDSGLLSQDGFTKMNEANDDYVPFFRLMDDSGGKGGPGKGLSVRAPVKAIKGSQRMIVDPIESIVKNTYLYIQLAERNRALTALADLADKAGDAGKELMERVPTPMRPVEVGEPEVARFMKDNGIEGNADSFTIFRPAPKRLANDEIALYRDGKMETYRVGTDVATAVRALDQQSINLLMKILAAPAKLLRTGVTLAPDFAARNFIRDQLTAFNLSPEGFAPIYDTLRGIGSIFKKDEEFQNWLKSGAANSAMVSIDRRYIEQSVLKINQETGFIGHAWNVVKSPIEGLKIMSELIENATRLGAFKRMNNGSVDPQSILAAGFGAREVTLDFQRIGAKTRAWNMITAFWNPAAQGIDKTFRAFRDQPMQTSLKLAASVTMPSILLWYANHDDPRWKDIPNWQKDLFWIVMTKDHIYRVPKPMELGILFGSLPERVLDAYHDANPNGFKQLGSDFLGALTPNYLPTFAVPIVEQFANRSTFTGNPIVPSSLEGILPEYQYSNYTTEAGKLLGKFVATVPGMKDSQLASPAVIENYIRAWSGQMGMYALQAADKALVASGAVPDPVKPASTLADIPVIKAFVIRYPAAGAQSIQDFYDRFSQAQKRIDTVHYLAKQGDIQASMKEMQLAQASDLWLNLSGVKEALSTQSKFIQLVDRNRDMKPDEKRQVIDGAYYMMMQVTTQGNQMLQQMQALEEAPVGGIRQATSAAPTRQ